jgi:hypothetical protein
MTGKTKVVDIEAPFVVRREGQREWHVPLSDDDMNWSLRKVTLCGLDWGGDGWAIGSMGPYDGRERTVCDACQAVLSAQGGPRKIDPAFERRETRSETRSVWGRFLTSEGPEIEIRVEAYRITVDGVEDAWSAPVFLLSTYTARLGETDVARLLNHARDLFDHHRLQFGRKGEG